MSEYAYIRVSSKTQNFDRQMQAMLNLGIEKKNIYADVFTGATFDRKEYKKMVKKLSEGDTLVIKSIDRLGRSYDEILEQWRYLIKEKKIYITVIDMPILNLSAHDSPLIKTFITDIVLQILSFAAENELNVIHQRQAEGIQLAKERGVKFGRPILKLPKKYQEVVKKYLNKEISSRLAGEQLGVSQTTFLKWIKEDIQNCKTKNKDIGNMCNTD